MRLHRLFEEVEDLLGHVRARTHQTTGREAASAQLDRLIIEGLLFSGLRNSELCRLRMSDTVLGAGRSVFVVRGTERSGRAVYIPQCVSDLVRQFAAGTRPAFLPPHIAADDLQQPLLFSERKTPYERTGLYRRVVRILTAAGLEDRASVQLLRHTYGYLAYARCGGNLLFLQRQLGHAHPMVTSIYPQFVEESYGAIAERVLGEPAPQTPPRRRARGRSGKGGKR